MLTFVVEARAGAGVGTGTEAGARPGAEDGARPRAGAGEAAERRRTTKMDQAPCPAGRGGTARAGARARAGAGIGARARLGAEVGARTTTGASEAVEPPLRHPQPDQGLEGEEAGFNQTRRSSTAEAAEERHAAALALDQNMLPCTTEPAVGGSMAALSSTTALVLPIPTLVPAPTLVPGPVRAHVMSPAPVLAAAEAPAPTPPHRLRSRRQHQPPTGG
jgi:hypothetical protein